MTERSHATAAVLSEYRKAVADPMRIEGHVRDRYAPQLAGALDSVTSERDALAAILDKLEALLATPTDDRGVTWWQWIDGGLGGSLYGDLKKLLSAAPTTALAARDADKWDEGAEAVANALMENTMQYTNPYRVEQEAQ